MPLTADEITKVQTLKAATEEWAANEKAEISRQVTFLEGLDLSTSRLSERVTAPIQALAASDLDALFGA